EVARQRKAKVTPRLASSVLAVVPDLDIGSPQAALVASSGALGVGAARGRARPPGGPLRPPPRAPPLALGQAHPQRRAPRHAGSRACALDPDVQLALEGLLEKKRVEYGAVVVVETPTGRVVALAGRSAREPSVEPATWALRGWAPAASVFKVVTAAALFEER